MKVWLGGKWKTGTEMFLLMFVCVVGGARGI